MKRLTGKTISGGIATGKIVLLRRNEPSVTKVNVENITEEFRRFDAAKKQVSAKIGEVFNKALESVGESDAEIFNAHSMILEDEDYNESVINLIKTQKLNAEYAVKVTGESFQKLFASMEDEAVQLKAIDVKDVTDQLIAALMNVNEDSGLKSTKGIIMAAEITPSDLFKMDKEKVDGIVTGKGTVNSHIGILTRTLGIPTITLEDIRESYNGQVAILDAELGELILSPESDTLKFYEEAKVMDTFNKESIRKSLVSDKAAFGDGLMLYANVGRLEDINKDVLELSDGIGLFRSEFIYMESRSFPTEKEQYDVYRKAALQMNGRKVVIRTLDIGDDKRMLNIGLEKNTSLSLDIRGIRMSLMCEDIFRTQIRAILRASAHGRVAIMYPMVTSLEEVISAKKIVEDVKKELIREGISFDKNIEQGVMIETPAAVMLSDDIAKEVDFFSIGTNDLTQYTLATNRYNERLEQFYNTGHESIRRMIKIVVNNAHDAGIPVCVCGEMASKPSFVKTLIDMDIDELSVNPSAILGIKRLIKEF